MKCYADSSFIVKLISLEPDSELAIVEFRRLSCPKLPLLALHELEIRNAILHKAWHQHRSHAARDRKHIQREKETARAKMDRMVQRGSFQRIAPDWEELFLQGQRLSERYTETNGTRSYDLLHVAASIRLECDRFLSLDDRQVEVARAEGLKVSRLG